MIRRSCPFRFTACGSRRYHYLRCHCFRAHHHRCLRHHFRRRCCASPRHPTGPTWAAVSRSRGHHHDHRPGLRSAARTVAGRASATPAGRPRCRLPTSRSGESEAAGPGGCPPRSSSRHRPDVPGARRSVGWSGPRQRTSARAGPPLAAACCPAGSGGSPEAGSGRRCARDCQGRCSALPLADAPGGHRCSAGLHDSLPGGRR